LAAVDVYARGFGRGPSGVSMSAKQEQQRDRLLAEVKKDVLKQHRGQRGKRIAQLAEAYYHRAPLDAITDRGAECLGSVLAAHSAFGQQRASQQALVRVFNPELDEHGYESRATVIEVVVDDMPFLVDSTTMVIGECGINTRLIIHPLLRVERDAGGHLMGIGPEVKDDDASIESWMHFEIDRQTDPLALERLQRNVEAALGDVRASVRDWSAMRDAAQKMTTQLSEDGAPAEAAEFIAWLLDENFTFLGYEEIKASKAGDEASMAPVEKSQLGILKHWSQAGDRPHLMADQGTRPLDPSEPIMITKTNARATVHRAGYMDYLAVQSFDSQQRLIGERRLVGLYTSTAYTRRPAQIPYVREKVDEVLRRSGLRENSHGQKALVHILETLPRDELFQSSIEELFDTVMGILYLQERQRTRLFIRRDFIGGFFSCLVFIPRDRFNTETRNRIQDILLKRLDGQRLDFNLQIGESTLARVYYMVRPKKAMVEPDVAAIEAELVETVRSWPDALRDRLTERLGEDRGLQLFQRYADALPAAYREDVSPKVASYDLERLAEIRTADDLAMSLYQPDEQYSNMLRFKVFKYGEPIPLSEVLPMLEDLGLHIGSERPYQLKMTSGMHLWVQDFDMQPASGKPYPLESVREKFQQAFEHVWRGDAESDGFNRLILSAQLHWRDVVLLRSYCKYLLQTGLPFSQPYMESTLNQHPHIVRVLVELFYALHDPVREKETANQARQAAERLQRSLEQVMPEDADSVIRGLAGVIVAARSESRQAMADACMEFVRQALVLVSSIDEDRILRSFADTMLATLRSNFYQQGANGRHLPYVAVKLDSAKVPDLPEPRPMFEIFVYSPRVEGVHLRGGKVARGGLRWSDRREDFRTEVLGLMKAQMVKNTLIVPVGAKGGFVVKQLPESGDRETLMAEVVGCYRMFISGLLDVTDNLVEGEVVPPLDVVRRDDDDTYLVVAADKGTATFSDIANSVSADYDFWMGDAFASGGSVGYDHKKMGITARGAWESVKRHFSELGIDCQTQDFTAVGVGDMGGDVFGNGMLLSKHIRLVAAFNHMHIFIDPSPDAASSFAERQRLFNLPRSTWEDYNAELISKGGGIYSRRAKKIELSAEARKALGLSQASLTPDELIRHILMAKVDLLWNGGIGTYVKGSTETHQQVGDRANDKLRVDGKQLRCRVVGEGGNLGLTQLARVEFAVAGGRCNTDSIDNSGGVDCSDHEVNIKILLRDVQRQGKINPAERDKLMMDMADEVAELVLRDNYLQTQAISMIEALSPQRLGAQVHFMKALEAEGLLDRELEFLPDDEALEERRARNLGLTRPELSILLSYAKMALKRELVDSDVPEDPYLSRELVRYFPLPLQQRFSDHMADHPLRREIICTAVTNSMVNRMGPTFALRMREDTGSDSAAVARAYSIAREIFQAREIWSQIEALDNKVGSDIQMDMILVLWNLLRQSTRWLLARNSCNLDIAKAVERFSGAIETLHRGLPKLVNTAEAKAQEKQAEKWQAADVPKALAVRVSRLEALFAALDIVEVANEVERSVSDVGLVYFQLGQSLKLEWLSQSIEKLPVQGQWHAHARGALRDDLFRQRRRLASLAFQQCPGHKAAALVDEWVESQSDMIRPAQRNMSEMMRQPQSDYATVLVALRAIVTLNDKLSGV
jgi:glutamate dehydrogenase